MSGFGLSFKNRTIEDHKEDYLKCIEKMSAYIERIVSEEINALVNGLVIQPEVDAIETNERLSLEDRQNLIMGLQKEKINALELKLEMEKGGNELCQELLEICIEMKWILKTITACNEKKAIEEKEQFENSSINSSSLSGFFQSSRTSSSLTPSQSLLLFACSNSFAKLLEVNLPEREPCMTFEDGEKIPNSMGEIIKKMTGVFPCRKMMRNNNVSNDSFLSREGSPVAIDSISETNLENDFPLVFPVGTKGIVRGRSHSSDESVLLPKGKSSKNNLFESPYFFDRVEITIPSSQYKEGASNPLSVHGAKCSF